MAVSYFNEVDSVLNKCQENDHTLHNLYHDAMSAWGGEHGTPVGILYKLSQQS